MGRQRIAAVLTACGALAAALPAQGAEAQAGAWKSLFDGASLDGWIPKIAGHPAGENYQQTFVARDGAIAVSYAGYDRFKNRFGHLFYKTPFKAYRLRLSYRFLDQGLPDTPTWARSNSGVMFHSQSPQSMELDQPFPMSVEFQALGADGQAPRPTGAVCTPGTSVAFDGVRAKAHCISPAAGPTIPNGTWVRLELEVLPSGEVTQKIDGVAVQRYGAVEVDPADPFAAAAKGYMAAFPGPVPLTEGYIALQSEGWPIEFKDIEIQELR